MLQSLVQPFWNKSLMRHSPTALGWLKRWSKSTDCSAIKRINIFFFSIHRNNNNNYNNTKVCQHQYNHHKHKSLLCHRLHLMQLLLLLMHSQRRCMMRQQLSEPPLHGMPLVFSDALLVFPQLVADAPRPGRLPIRNGSYVSCQLSFFMTRRVGPASVGHAITSVVPSTRSFFG